LPPAFFSLSAFRAASFANPNEITIQLKDGPVVIQLMPEVAPKHVAQIKELAARRAPTTMSPSTASSKASWPRPATSSTATWKGLHKPRRPAPAVRICRIFRPNSRRRRLSAARSAWRARRIPNSANSQFFIMFADGDFLNGQYTVVGKVVSGMENVDKIKRGEGQNGEVTDPDRMVKVTIGKK
jgi:cyclophilin family peptidyl-prolyl cis-trans isomerase